MGTAPPTSGLAGKIAKIREKSPPQHSCFASVVVDDRGDPSPYEDSVAGVCPLLAICPSPRKGITVPEWHELVGFVETHRDGAGGDRGGHDDQ